MRDRGGKTVNCEDRAVPNPRSFFGPISLPISKNVIEYSVLHQNLTQR